MLVEIAASLALLMVVTGLYLHWPRNGAGLQTLLIPNLRTKGRAWWKSLHSVLGLWIPVLLVFFLISGLAWAGIWDGKFAVLAVDVVVLQNLPWLKRLVS